MWCYDNTYTDADNIFEYIYILYQDNFINTVITDKCKHNIGKIVSYLLKCMDFINELMTINMENVKINVKM